VAETGRVKVKLPPEGDQDGPKLVHIGVIAAVCFLIGIAWPTLADIRLVPSVPNRGEPAQTPKPKATPAAAENGGEIPVAKAAVVATPENPGAAQATLMIKDSLIVNCRDAEGRKVTQCDKPGFDSVAEPRLKALLGCEAVKDASGTLSIGFELDFAAEKITRIVHGKSTTFNEGVTTGLLECAKREFMTATLRGVPHTHPNYLQFYVVQFLPASQLAATGTDPLIPASGSATVVWNSARVRSQPDGGEVRTQLLYGTRLVVTARQGDWVRVRYDSQGNEGWVHKNALAL
jgi:Bacterial SH3 domain